DTIEVRRLDDRMAGAAQGVETLVVGEDEQDVRLLVLAVQRCGGPKYENVADNKRETHTLPRILSLQRPHRINRMRTDGAIFIVSILLILSGLYPRDPLNAIPRRAVLTAAEAVRLHVVDERLA